MPDLKQALRDFVATSNSGKYSDEETLLSKFPELQGYDIEVLRDFVATSNSGKYATEDEIFAKFPEFDLKKKEVFGPLPAEKEQSFTEFPSAVGPSVSPEPIKPKPTAPTETLAVGPMGITGLQRTAEYVPASEEGKQGDVLNLVSSLDKGFYKNLIGSPVKGLGTALEGVTGKGFVSDALIKFGNYFNKTIDELTPQDEEFKNSLTDQFGQAFGQVASLVVTQGAAGALSKAPTAVQAAKTALAAQTAPTAVGVGAALKTLGSELASPTSVSAGLSMGQSEFERAKEAGATDDQAFEAFYKNAAVGSVLEKIPVMQFFKRFNQASAGGVANYLKTKAIGGITGGIEEMTTEVLQQLYANKTAQDIYNVNQDLFEGVGESGGVGFGVGFLLNAMGANAKLLRKEGKEQEANVVEQQIKEFENQAQRGGPSSYTVNGIAIQPIIAEGVIQQEPRDIVSSMIDNMTATDLSKMNIDITNDPELNIKLQDKIVSSSIKEQVREANPNLSEEQLDEVTNLERELRKFEGNTTQSGKDRAAAIRSQIKTIQEDAIQKQAAGEVPVQPRAGVSETLEEGKPQAEPEGVTAEGVTEEVVQEEVTPQQEEIERYRLSDEVYRLKNAIPKADDTDAAIAEYNAAKKTLEEFDASITERQGKARAKNNVQSLIEDETTASKQEGYEYKKLYEQDPRLASLQSSKDLLEFVKSEDIRERSAQRGETIEEAQKSKERSLSIIQQDIADLEADLQANPVVSLKTQPEVVPAQEETIANLEREKSKLTLKALKQFPQSPAQKKTVARIDEINAELKKLKTQPVVEQYVPITPKQITNEKFTRDNAIDYEEGERETDSGRTVTYLASLTVEAQDENGDVVGSLTKITDEDGIVSWQAADIDGNELSFDGFDSKDEAKQALVDKINKVRKKEFDKKAKAKAKKSKFAKDETVRPEPTRDRTGRTKGGTIAPLEGAPSVQGVNGPDPQLVAVAEQYAKDNGIPFTRQAEYVKVDEDRAKRIADAYEQMANDPQNPKVKEAYENLIKQTMAQYQALVDAGYKFWFMDLNIPSNAEYASSPYNAIRDLRKNKEMGVFPTTDGYGASGLTELDVENNPLLADTGIRWGVGGVDGPKKNVLANDLFRAVHDAFGHGLEGSGFRARGEENAWQAHVRLFNGSAIAALTSETRGQNSWLNYGPFGDKNKTAKVEDTVFAEQKVGLMPEWTWNEGRAADMKPAEEEGPTMEEMASIDALLDLDVEDEDNMLRVLNALDNADKAITKTLRGGAFDSLLAIPLSTVQVVIKGLKVLVQGGMKLRDAIRKVAADNNLSQDTIKDIMNISPIQDGFNELMSKVDALIERQRARGVEAKRMTSNVDTFVRNSEVYQEANDAQKKIMEREARAKMGVSPRRAPSIGRILGALKDITNVSRKDKLKIISEIRKLSKDAAKDLAKEINELADKGKITVKQAANIVARFGKVNMLSEISVSKFVDYMTKMFADAEYAQKISNVKSKLGAAKKNIASKIGIADGLMVPLQKMLSIDPTLIPDKYFDRYAELVNMFGERKAVLTLEDKQKVTKDVNEILDAINAEQSQVLELAERMKSSENKVEEDGKLDYAKTVKSMLENKEIDEKEADVMMKYQEEISEDVEPTEEEDKQPIINEINSSKINADGLPSKDERDLAKKLSKLIKSSNLNRLSTRDLKNLLKVIDNINNGYLPHYAELLVERINALDDSKVLDKAISTAKPIPFSNLYARLKSLFTKNKNFSELIRRNPLYYIDQVFGNFNTKEIFQSLFEKPAEAQAKFAFSEKQIANRLKEAELKVAKSFNMDANKTTMSKYKMMVYMLQREFESNPNNKQVNPASKFLQETIDHIENGKSSFTDRDVEMLEKIQKDYSDANGEINADKLFKSFNPAEKSAIKEISNINEEMRDKAVYTSAIIRGDKISPLTDYVHHYTLLDDRQNEDITGASALDNYANTLRPSTRAKSLLSRTGKATPLNFDVFAATQRGAKFVLMDYYLTEPIRTSRKTINETSKLLKERKADKKQRDIFNAISSAFDEATENLLTQAFVSTSLADDVVDYISKQGYRAVLASIPRFASELTSNVAFATIVAPKDFGTGVGMRKFIFSTDAAKAVFNLNSKQLNRLFPSHSLSGKMVDTSVLNDAIGVKGSRAKNDIANKIQQIYNLSIGKYANSVELTADALISTPDKITMRPVWFGAFTNEFKKLTGKDPDFDKIANNDEAYMSENKENLDKATLVADKKSVLMGASDNAFMGILKGTTKPNQSGFIRSFNRFNNFMTTFLIYEYVTARTGIMAAMKGGQISRKQGIALLGGVTARMVLYTLLINVLSSAMTGLFVDDEEEDEKSFLQKLGQSFASAFSSMILGRDFGNVTKTLVNYGAEKVNQEYLEFLREGEYDPYKDAIQYSVLPIDKQGKPEQILFNMMGPFSPSAKTAYLIAKKALEKPKEEKEAIERAEKEKNIRVPLEFFGNLGMVPLYKDIHKIVNTELYKDLGKTKKTKGRGSSMTKEDMKTYFPEMYNDLYGPGGALYDIELMEKEIEKEQKKIEKEMKESMYR